MTLDSPVAFTGAGRGLGRPIAEVFHRRGTFVVATDFDPGLLADLAGVGGDRTLAHDVRDTTRAAEIAATIASDCGRLDVIVNNAGVSAFYPVCESPPERTIRAFMINTFGALIQTPACFRNDCRESWYK